MKSIVFTFLLSFFFVTIGKTSVLIDPPLGVKIIEKDFPFFKDKDVRTFYVDLELLSRNIKEVKVITKKGNVAIQDSLVGEEVDMIYELDYSKLLAGKYSLELHTYTGKILKSSFELE